VTSRPEFAREANYALGVGALALFCVLVAAVALSSFDAPAWYPSGSVTAAIGYAILGRAGQTDLLSNGFIAAFEVVDVVLVAALVAAVTLARRDDGGER